MGDVDAGTVKATVRIVLEDEGTQQAEERLNNLKDAAGSVGDAMAGAGDNFAQFGEQVVTGAESTKTFSEALGELPKIVEEGGTAITNASGAVDEHTQAVEEAASAHEDFQSAVEDTTTALQKAAPPMQVISDHVQAMNENLAQVQQVADTLDWEAIGPPPEWGGLSQAASDNMAVLGQFNKAVDDPNPWAIINDHLVKTGQTWNDFTGTIGEDNAQLLNELAANSNDVRPALDNIGSGFGVVATSAQDANKAVDDFLGQSGINALGGFGTEAYGPFQMAEKAAEGGGFADLFGGFTNTLSQIAMPLMAVQMIGMAVGTVASGIYNMAAIAEGPAAHSVGTFTGTIDALSQSAQHAGESFSENFGQGILPTLNAMNAQSGQNNDFMGFLGKDIGTNLGALADLWQIGTGVNFMGGVQGLANLGASWLGFQQPFQGPAPVPQAQLNYEQQMAALPTTVQGQVYQLRTQTSITLADALNPDYLQAQDQLTASQQLAQRLQASYNASHPINQNQLLADARYQQYVDSQGPPQQQSYPDLFTSFWGNIFGGIGNFLTAPIPAAKNYPGLQSMGASNFDFSGITGDIGQALSSIHLPHLDLSGIASNIGGAISGIQIPHIDLSGISGSLSGALSGIQMPHLDLSSITSSLAGAFSGIQIPSLPDIGSRIGGQLSGMFSGITLPSIPDFGARLSGELSGMFSGLAIPSIPQLGAMLTGAMSGMFAGIQLPAIPNLGAALSGALSSMLGSVGTSIPMFGSGVEGYSGLAVVGESGPELVSLNGGSVYPMTQSTGGSAPISFGGGGGSAPQSFNIVVNLESQAILSAIGLPLAQTVRVQSGMRGY